MKDIKIYLSINDYQINEIGKLKENIIKFKNNEENITYNLTENILIKESLDLIIALNFNSNKVSYYIKEYDKEIISDIDIKEKNIKENEISIKYELNDSIFNLNIKYEVI